MLDGVWYDGIIGAMRLGGDYYEGRSANQKMTWQKENVSQEISDPWLYTFDMDAQGVEAASRKETGEGYEIRLMVYGPWDFASVKCDEYYVDFCFDHEGNFRYAIRYIHATGELMGETVPQSIISTMYAYEPTEVDFVSAVKSYAGNLEQELDLDLRTAFLEPGAPDWGIQVALSNVTPTGLTYEITQSGELIGQQLFFGQYYSLARWTGSGWEAVEPIIDNGAFTMEAILLQENHTTCLHINWEWLYGPLPEGTYRIGKSISNEVEVHVGVNGSLSDGYLEETSYTYYAEFVL